MKSKGTTLLELMVVMVIISIMAAIALPNLSGYISKKALIRQGDEFVAIISQVRDRAMAQGITWRIHFWPGEKRCLGYGDANNNASLDSGEQQLGPYHLAEGISYGSHASAGPNKSSIPSDAVSFVNNRTSFSPMGTCNAGTIYLKSEDRSIAIRVLPSSGLVRMWEYNDSWQVVK